MKYWNGSVPPKQLGFLQSKALNVGMTLKKFAMQVGIKWPCHYSKFLVLKNHGNHKWAGCKTLIVRLVSICLILSFQRSCK